MNLKQLSEEELSDRIREFEELRASRDTYDLSPCQNDLLSALYSERERRINIYLAGMDSLIYLAGMDSLGLTFS